MRRVGGTVLALAALCALAAGCGGGSGSTARTAIPPASTPATSPTGSAAWGTPSGTTPGSAAGSSAATSGVAEHVSKLAVVVLENHSRTQALKQMPFLAAQAKRYGEATQWYAMRHPSLPNYLELVGGSTFGVSDDDPPSSHRLTSQTVFGQLAAHGRSVRTYVEGMPTTCATTNHGRYAVKHNPWAYFVHVSERLACRRYDVPMGSSSSGALHDDVAAGRLPTYALLIPDLCHDAHDCGLATADAWLETWVTQIEHGPDFRSGRLALVVTFDEDDRHAGNHIATVVMAAQLHHQQVSTRFTHASLAAAPSRLAGLPPLRGGAGTPDVLAAFGLRWAQAAAKPAP